MKIWTSVDFNVTKVNLNRIDIEMCGVCSKDMSNRTESIKFAAVRRNTTELDRWDLLRRGAESPAFVLVELTNEELEELIDD